MATARVRHRTTAWRLLVVLLVAGLGFVVAPPASAACAPSLAMRSPATVVAGVPFAVTVSVLGSGGRVDRAYRGTVGFSTDDQLVRALPARYAFTRADRGTHTFTGVTLVGTGTHRLAVRDVRHLRLHDTDRVRVAGAGAAVEGQVLSGFDPVEGGIVTIYDAVTGLVLGRGPADIDGYLYRITGLPAGDIKVGAVVPGPYEPDFANDKDSLELAEVFTLTPGVTLVQSWEPEDFGPYLDVEHVLEG